MKLTTLFISNTRQIFAKVLAVPESSIKTKASSLWTLSVILLTSAVICKQMFKRFIQTNLQKYKCYNVEQQHFRQPFYSSAMFMKKYHL